MELSQEQLFEILRRFESNPEPQDVRRTARIAIRRHVTILTDPETRAGEKEVVLQDISRGGVSLTHHDAMPPEKKFLMLLPADAGEPIELPCVVRHCEMVKQHLFRIGAQFELREDQAR